MKSIPTPPEVLQELMSLPYSNKCWRNLLLHDHQCQGRLTWEHAILHAGKRVNETWAIVRLCAWAHEVDEWQDGGGMNKAINRWIALGRITDWEAVESKYPRTSWRQDLRYLDTLYGHGRLSGGR